MIKEAMFVNQNLHIHTTYADGKDTPEEIVLKAVEKGFDSIGFSEHTYNAYSIYPNQMAIEEMTDYQKEIHRLKEKYQSQIEIFCGLEYELYSDVPVEGFDYLIGSVHYLDINGRILGFDSGAEAVKSYLADNFDGDGLKFAGKYYETLCRLPQKHPFDIIGHFDLMTKTNETLKFLDTTSKTYLRYGYEAIHSLKGKIPIFEVNTGAIARGYRTAPYPQMEFLKEFKTCGFHPVITSDCHNKEFIDCCFDEAKELLLEAGFRTKCVLTANGFEEVEL